MDTEFVRWPLKDLAGYLDGAISTIVTVKPSASSATIDISLVRGTKQAVPDDQRIVQLLDIMSNKEGVNGAGGRAIRATSRAELDSNVPRWRDPAHVPFRKEVRQFIFDELLPREFWVTPGNDGTGIVEAVVSMLPLTLVEQLNGADPAVLESWDIPIGLPDNYEPAILDFILYRAFNKEDPAAAPQRALTHYQAFATAIGLQTQVEASTSPSRKK
nr:DUF6682 family protein [Rhizobium sp. 18065]